MKSKEDLFKEKFKETLGENQGNMSFYKEMDYNQHKEFTPKKYHLKGRGGKVAIILVAFFICTSAMAIMISNDTVSAFKDKMTRFFVMDKSVEDVAEKEPYSLVIDDFNDKEALDEARQILPNIIILERMFDDYIFSSLYIEKIDDNNIFSSIYYVSEDGQDFHLGQNIMDEDTASYGLYAPDKTENYNGGQILLTRDIDNDKGLNSVVYIKDNAVINLTGWIDENMLISFIKTNIII